MMNRKVFNLLLFSLVACMNLAMFSGCKDYTKDDKPLLKIYINNESTSTLKHIYWISDVLSGAVDIDVPPNTTFETSVSAWPGKIFHLMVTAADTDQYVKWEDVESDSDPDVLYLSMLDIDIQLFVSCALEAYFIGYGHISTSYPNSVENTLPSMP